MSITIRLSSGFNKTFDKTTLTIGSDPCCDVVIAQSNGVQPLHARIRKIGDRWLLESAGAWPCDLSNLSKESKQWVTAGASVGIGSGETLALLSATSPASASPMSSIPKSLPTASAAAENAEHRPLSLPGSGKSHFDSVKAMPAHSPSFTTYISNHYRATRGLWVWWLMLGILAALVLDVLKPAFGFHALLKLFLATGSSAIAFTFCYTTIRLLTYFVKKEGHVVPTGGNWTARLSYGSFILCFSIGLLLITELLSPKQGILATLLPEIRGVQDTLTSNINDQLGWRASVERHANNAVAMPDEHQSVVPAHNNSTPASKDSTDNSVTSNTRREPVADRSSSPNMTPEAVKPSSESGSESTGSSDSPPSTFNQEELNSIQDSPTLRIAYELGHLDDQEFRYFQRFKRHYEKDGTKLSGVPEYIQLLLMLPSKAWFEAAKRRGISRHEFFGATNFIFASTATADGLHYDALDQSQHDHKLFALTGKHLYEY